METQAQVDAVDKTVLRKLRDAYERLQDAQTLINTIPAWVKGQPVSAVDLVLHSDGRGPTVEEALDAINTIGGSIYGAMNAPCPELLYGHDELTEAQMDAYFDLVEAYADHWVSEGALPMSGDHGIHVVAA